ncbi:hypothetical protein NC653_030121 [Populus alba x Populus x berolinensis]|uniref:Uncharacterized protein n=1 Tax=Populus alba x Populus x berolinensis TaxID=444605 RepID=A0AAD6PZV8_9ROSI|nr:hypothetical protein NC653_030121 [Populus alba x Populus x berolinensis]
MERERKWKVRELFVKQNVLEFRSRGWDDEEGKRKPVGICGMENSADEILEGSPFRDEALSSIHSTIKEASWPCQLLCV